MFRFLVDSPLPPPLPLSAESEPVAAVELPVVWSPVDAVRVTTTTTCDVLTLGLLPDAECDAERESSVEKVGVGVSDWPGVTVTNWVMSAVLSKLWSVESVADKEEEEEDDDGVGEEDSEGEDPSVLGVDDDGVSLGVSEPDAVMVLESVKDGEADGDSEEVEDGVDWSLLLLLLLSDAEAEPDSELEVAETPGDPDGDSDGVSEGVDDNDGVLDSETLWEGELLAEEDSAGVVVELLCWRLTKKVKPVAGSCAGEEADGASCFASSKTFNRMCCLSCGAGFRAAVDAGKRPEAEATSVLLSASLLSVNLSTSLFASESWAANARHSAATNFEA